MKSIISATYVKSNTEMYVATTNGIFQENDFLSALIIIKLL